MPKSLQKLKHGRRAAKTSTEDSSPSPTSATRPSSTSTAQSQHRSASHSHSSWAELRRDKVLRKLCAKASGQKPSSKAGLVASSHAEPPTSALASSDQASLKDCPMVIRPDDLWGSAPEPAPVETNEAPSSHPTPTPSPPVLDASVSQPAALLSPEQIQQMISTAVQQALAPSAVPPAGLLPLHWVTLFLI